MSGSPSRDDQIVALAVELMLVTTMEEIASLVCEGQFRPILLKGPYVASRLDLRDSLPAAADLDVLVSADQVGYVQRWLSDNGYVPETRTSGSPAVYGQAWRHASRVTVDLHTSVWGAEEPDTVVWTGLSNHAVSTPSGLTVLDDVGLAVMLATQLAQHDGDPAKLVPLLRAREVLSSRVWLDAESLARRIGALPAFSAGLALAREGRRSDPVDELPVAGFADLDELVGTRARARFLMGKLFPSPSVMRLWRTSRPRSNLSVALAYVYRPLWLARWLPQGYLAWQRAKRARNQH